MCDGEHRSKWIVVVCSPSWMMEYSMTIWGDDTSEWDQRNRVQLSMKLNGYETELWATDQCVHSGGHLETQFTHVFDISQLSSCNTTIAERTLPITAGKEYNQGTKPLQIPMSPHRADIQQNTIYSKRYNDGDHKFDCPHTWSSHHSSTPYGMHVSSMYATSWLQR